MVLVQFVTYKDINSQEIMYLCIKLFENVVL